MPRESVALHRILVKKQSGFGLKGRDCTVLASFFGFDDTDDFVEFAVTQQAKANMREGIKYPGNDEVGL